MSLLAKLKNVLTIWKRNGAEGVINILQNKYYILFRREKYYYWKKGIKDELYFWDEYFRTKGLRWPHNYINKMDPSLPLQQRPSELLPPQKNISILDVGAGPLTSLGKICNGHDIYITAIDPLADYYDDILKNNNITPIVKTENLQAEKITKRFSTNTFDLVYARNCLDHAYNPEKSILNMMKVVKNGCFILLEHRLNEAENQNYKGLHQWNFSVNDNGDFIIWSKNDTINFTKRYGNRGEISCEIIHNEENEPWLITRIKKHDKNEN